MALKSSRLSQAAVARESGLGTGNVSRLVRGERISGLTVATLMRFARAVGVPVSELLGETTSPNDPIEISAEALGTNWEKLLVYRDGVAVLPKKSHDDTEQAIPAAPASRGSDR